jgi:hypothetical protein
MNTVTVSSLWAHVLGKYSYSTHNKSDLIQQLASAHTLNTKMYLAPCQFLKNVFTKYKNNKIPTTFDLGHTGPLIMDLYIILQFTSVLLIIY